MRLLFLARIFGFRYNGTADGRIFSMDGGLVHRLGRSSRRTCAALGLRRSARWGATHAPPIASSGLILLVLLPAFFSGRPYGSSTWQFALRSHCAAVKQLTDAVAAA